MIWIEILSRNKELINRHRSLVDIVSIGRGYDNNIVIDDPYVAPGHLRIYRNNEGAIIAKDLGTRNGVFDEAGKKHASIVLTGNKLIRIGQTWLRIRDADFPVATERLLSPQIRLWPWLLLLLVLVPASILLPIWLLNSHEHSIVLYLGPLISIGLMFAIWIGLWSLVSRLFSGAARFSLHAIIALTGFLISQSILFLQKWLTFAFSSSLIAHYSFPVLWLLFALVCYAHLRAISAKNVKLKAAIVLSLAICACLTQWLMKQDNPFMQEDSAGGYPYLSQMFPSSWRVVAPKSETDFVSETKKLKGELDALREKEPRKSMFDDFFGDFSDIDTYSDP
ncbi:MAG: FHA domain-containing protein [Burkholderiales bacterium]|jgi:hypothetical protein|nr:FHA domain-containing protein [Burkholderiales bacterium]